MNRQECGVRLDLGFKLTQLRMLIYILLEYIGWFLAMPYLTDPDRQRFAVWPMIHNLAPP